MGFKEAHKEERPHFTVSFHAEALAAILAGSGGSSSADRLGGNGGNGDNDDGTVFAFDDSQDATFSSGESSRVPLLTAVLDHAFMV